MGTHFATPAVMANYKKILVLIILTLAVFTRCSPPKFSNDVRQQSASASDYFSDSVVDFAVAVFYEDQAAPYVDDLGNGVSKTWEITRASFKALFQTHTSRTITVPDSLPEMRGFGNHNKARWSEKELIQLATSLIAVPPDRHKVANVFFVKGNYEGDTRILGVSFSGYRFAFIFKDVIVGVGGDTYFQHYVEQATVVHEVGHVVGLVNNGLPMFTRHEDLNHLNHTNDPKDVMYWQLTSPESIAASVKAFSLAHTLSLNQNLNLFGLGSLEDARHFHTR